MDMKSLRKKQNRYRGLRAVSYLLGCPLLLLVVFVASVPFMNGDAFVDVKYYGIIACAAIWLVCIVGQIIISLITKSNTGRTLFMLVLSLILTVGATVFCDLYVGKKVEEINANEDYKAYDVSIESYKYLAGWVITWTKKESATDKFNDEMAHFTEVYNIGYKSNIYADFPKDDAGKDIKTGGYVNPDGSPVTYDKKEDAYYSQNGLYADGYVFGVKQALKVITTYYKSKLAIEEANGYQFNSSSGDYVKMKETGELVAIKKDGQYIKDEEGVLLYNKLRDEDAIESGFYVRKANPPTADEILEAALAAQEADPHSEWNEYKKTDEYLDAYGTDGTAYKHMFSEKHLKSLVATLFSGIGNMKQLNKAITLVSTFVDVDELLADNLGITVAEIKTMTFDGLLDVVNNRMSDELKDTVGGLLEGFGMSLPLTTADVMSLLSKYFYYQAPTVKPAFMFLEDQTLVDYAWAKYEGQTHGANVGSVLIPKETIDDEGNVSFSNLGKVTMSDSGYPVEMAYGTGDSTKIAQKTLAYAYQVQADDSIAVPYFPLMVARRFVLIFSGIIAATFVAFFYANRRAREYADAIDNA